MLRTPPPIARKSPKLLSTHGDTRIDHYYWLRDKSDPDTLPYLEAENAYTAAIMEPLAGLQERIYQEILSRIQQTDLTVPVKNGDYYYYSRTREGMQYPVWCRTRGFAGSSLEAPSPEAPSLEADPLLEDEVLAEEVLLDGNALAKGHAFFAIGGLTVSDDQNLLLFSVDNDGSERYTIRVKNLITGQLLDDTIPQTSSGLTWAGDNQTFFYTTFDETHRPEKVRRHRLGTNPASDPVVFHEADTQFEFAVHRTRSKRYVIVTSTNASLTTEVHYLDAFTPDELFRVIEPRKVGVEYYADHQGGRFLIRTNAGGATTFKLMAVPVEQPGADGWELLLAAQPDVTLDGVEPFRNFLVLETREEGLPRLRVWNLIDGERYAINFPEPAYAAGLDANREYDTSVVRLQYTSLLTPASIYDFDMTQRTRVLRKQMPVLGGYDPGLYASERIYAPAADGKLIPVSLAYRRGLRRDGSAPLLLNAYGSYGFNSDPAFSHSALSLLDRGFVWAIAHVRGGAEYGRSWFEDGRLLNKKNTFTDFIAAAEYLVAERFTSPGTLAAMGGSAGGLLMGAVANMRPDLFHAIVARVPFVDVVTTMLDPSIPLTTGEYDQWGNPEDPVHYDYMKSYSPYDNVQAQAYPHILITTGINDPRVAFWEPAKWTARLRALKTDDRLLLLKTDLGAGHGGASGRYERMKETAFIYAFLLETLGRREQQPA